MYAMPNPITRTPFAIHETGCDPVPFILDDTYIELVPTTPLDVTPADPIVDDDTPVEPRPEPPAPDEPEPPRPAADTKLGGKE